MCYEELGEGGVDEVVVFIVEQVGVLCKFVECYKFDVLYYFLGMIKFEVDEYVRLWSKCKLL